MKGTIRATVQWGAFPQKEKRFVKGTPKRVIESWKTRTKALMMKRSPQPERAGKPGTLTKDATVYYTLVRHLKDYARRPGLIRPWLTAFGDRPRHTITTHDVLRVRGEWIGTVSARHINNRVSALRNLYETLDGKGAPTPCDHIAPLRPPRIPHVVVDPAIVNTVLSNLLQRSRLRDRRGRPPAHCLEDRARLMVLAASGKRPCEVEWAQPDDVDLGRRVWTPRDAKGGFCPGVYIHDELFIAWTAFIMAKAWGPFPEHFEIRLQRAGWPKGLRIYNLRHSTWTAASEAGIDLADIQAGAGHKRIQTTRDHYVPVLNSRMQRLGEAIDHRFGWQGGLAPQDVQGKTH
jgi:integrase